MEVLSPATFAEEQGSLWAFWFVWRYEISVSIIKALVFYLSQSCHAFFFSCCTSSSGSSLCINVGLWSCWYGLKFHGGGVGSQGRKDGCLS